MKKKHYLLLGILIVLLTVGVAGILPAFSDEDETETPEDIDRLALSYEVEGYPSANVCKTCHPKHFDQWRVSPHAYGQISPFFTQFTKMINQKTSGTNGTFCTRCHSPISVILGEEALAPIELRNIVSNEGVTCVVCHRLQKNHGRTRGELVIASGVLEAPLYGPFKDIKEIPIGRDGKKTHKAVATVNIRSSQFCGQCHDVTAPTGFRLEDLFTEWRNSPAAKEGTTCQDCHMGTVQGVKSPRAKGQIAFIKEKTFPVRTLSDHTFPGPDYPVLPITQFPIREYEWPLLMGSSGFYKWKEKVDRKIAQGKKLNRLDKRKMKKYDKLVQKSRDLRAMYNRKRYEILGNASSMTVAVPETIERGDNFKVEVVVKNEITGHGFPAGFSAERQVWLHVTVKDDQGQTIYETGDLDANGDLRDDKSLEVITGRAKYDHHLFNLQSKFKLRTIAGTERSDHFPVPRDVDNFQFVRPPAFLTAAYNSPFMVRQQKNSLPAAGSRKAKFKIKPKGDSAYYDVTVDFNFRHFAPILIRQLEADEFIPQLEVVKLDAQKFRVAVR